ncbi:MAG TPA: Lrp/AsnC family transcriptional regulator [Anaerolineaceae bacterium]|nr:Lrp/AsnC family transcriptional regulator [Anaerolineaceae bacterium]
MAIKLDRLDKQIVDLLTTDGRMSSKEMARRIEGATERAVRYRLNRLIQTGVIAISAIVDPQKIGFPVIADVFLEVDPSRVLELADLMARYDNVTYVACSTGEHSISVQIVARDNRHLYQFVTETIGRLSGIRRTTTSIVPLIVKDDAHWRIPETVIKKE